MTIYIVIDKLPYPGSFSVLGSTITAQKSGAVKPHWG
jgi:hypothetical protein